MICYVEMPCTCIDNDLLYRGALYMYDNDLLYRGALYMYDNDLLYRGALYMRRQWFVI